MKTSIGKWALSGIILAGLAACNTPVDSRAPSANWSNIQVAETIERLELYARPNGLDLSARDEMAVAQFLQGYGQFGDGPLYVNMPSHQASAPGGQQTQALLKRVMHDIGLGRASMQSGQYQSMPGQMAPVVVSYRRLKTLPVDCAQADSLSMTYTNQPHAFFGCSFHANLAAMIQDPRQLLEPYPSSSPDMKRRMQVYDKYILGESPASELPERQDINVENRN